jgi:hypothetical protein
MQAFTSMVTTLLQIGLGVDGTIGFGRIDANQLIVGSVKIMFVIAGILYLVFAGLVLRQVYIMKHTVVTSFSPIVVLLGYAHLVLAVLVFLFFLGL